MSHEPTREQRRRIIAAVSPTEQVRREAQEVLDYIRQEAERRARRSLSISTTCRFYRILRSRYLSDYLRNPSQSTGNEAIGRIGRKFVGSARDEWEATAITEWNHQPVPEAFRRLRPSLPEEIEAATDIISLSNCVDLPIIDVPFLLGPENLSRAMDADVYGGGSNISQLMHWATGVKYSHIRMNDLRELFLGYELWHLEGWDGFEEDPINDLIAEESGRILGTQLRAASITESNLARSLNSAFDEARAWVGSLLRLRRDDLNLFLTSRTARRCRWWWSDDQDDIYLAWNGETIYGMLHEGTPIDGVRRSDLVDRFIGVYALIYEADEWEGSHGRILNTQFIVSMASGELNDVFRQIARGQSVPSSRQRDVYSIARER